MRHGQHPNRLFPDDEWEVVGKGFQIDATLMGTADSIYFRMFTQMPDCAFKFPTEPPPQAWVCFLVVEYGIQKLLLSLPHKPD